MRFYLLTVGRVTAPYLQQGTMEFLRRLRPYADVVWETVDEEPIPKRLRAAEVAEAIRREGDRLLRKIDALPAGTYRIALAIDGRAFSSEELAAFIDQLSVSGVKACAWIVGGPLGLDPRIQSSADLRLSLSRLTFTHQFVPLILLEQLYRAYRIIRHEPYHY